MIFNKMDDTLMKIYEIKDIEEINFTDLTPANITESKLVVVPCIYVRYDGGKFLNLCINDKYFDVYIKRIIEVYNEEKDKVIQDDEFNPFGQKTIKIDEKSKRLLESDILTKINEIYKLYENKKSYDNNLLVQKDEFELLLPLIIYHLKKLLDYTDLNITFNDDIVVNGYRNNYTINCKIDGIDEILYIRFNKKSEFEYSFEIRSSSRKFKPIRFEYGMYDNFISSMIYMDDYNISASDIYKILDNKILHEETIYKDHQRLVHKDGYLPECENNRSDITDIDNSDEMKWFSLPWNALYGINNNIEEVSDTESFLSKHNKYVSFYKDNFMIREYAGKVYRRNKTFNANEYSIGLDEVSKKISGTKLYDNESIYLISTYFQEVESKSGYYDTYLNRKYYYHLIDKKDKFTPMNLVSVSKDDDIIYGADLEDKDNVKMILRREK